ncbi:MAG: PorP/SprF family type IX secretion system membrane protein [Ferruginibacter sp.]
MFYRKICFGFLLIASFNIKAQDASFTQFYNSPLYLNPAFTGCGRSNMRFSGVAKMQWFNLYQPYKFVTGALDFSFYDDYLRDICNLGLIVNNESKGPFTNTSISGIIAKSFGTGNEDCSNWFLSIALQAGYTLSNINKNNLLFIDQIDANGPTGLPSQVDLLIAGNKNYADFSSGFIFTCNNWMIGAAVHHLNEPDISFYGNPNNSKLPRKFTGHFSYTFDPDDANVKIKPTIIYEAQSVSRSLVMGSLIDYNELPIEIGLWYRNNFSLSYNNSFSVGLTWKWGAGKNINSSENEYSWHTGVSYDAELNKPSAITTYGSSELGVSKDISLNSGIPCPTASSGICHYRFPWEFF